MDEFEWNVETEAHLLEAMIDHKPVGVNKYFHMLFIWEKFIENSHKDIQSDKIWEHLESMYNLESLDDSESLPFPNDETDFYLPEMEYGGLKLKRDEKPEERKYILPKGKEPQKLLPKEIVKKEEKAPRRDSKDGKETKSTPVLAKKEIKKEPEKKPQVKGRLSTTVVKEESKPKKNDDTPRPPKRPTRGSMKPEDASSTGKASPVNVSNVNVKRRRI